MFTDNYYRDKRDFFFVKSINKIRFTEMQNDVLFYKSSNSCVLKLCIKILAINSYVSKNSINNFILNNTSISRILLLFYYG